MGAEVRERSGRPAGEAAEAAESAETAETGGVPAGRRLRWPGGAVIVPSSFSKLLLGVAVAPSTLGRVGSRVPRPDGRSLGPLLHPGPGTLLAIGAFGALAVFVMTLKRSRRWLGGRAVRSASAMTRLAREMKDLKAVL